MVYVEHQRAKSKNVEPFKKYMMYGLQTMAHELDLAFLVKRGSINIFEGKVNDEVEVALPGFLPARRYAFRNDRTDEMILDNYSETTVKIKTADRLYSGTRLTPEQMQFDDFAWADTDGLDNITGTSVRNLMGEQARAVGRHFNQEIASNLENAPFHYSVGPLTTNPYEVIMRAKTIADHLCMPTSGRYLVIGSEVEFLLLLDKRFITASSSGEKVAARALTEARIGSISGIPVYRSHTVNPKFAAILCETSYVPVVGVPLSPPNEYWGRVHDPITGLGLRYRMGTEFLRDQTGCIVDMWTGGLHPYNYISWYDESERIQKRSKNKYYLHGVKINFDTASTAPAAGDELANITELSDANLYVPTPM